LYESRLRRLMMNHGGAAAVIAAAKRRGHQRVSELIVMCLILLSIAFNQDAQWAPA